MLKSLALKSLPIAFLRRRLARTTTHVRSLANYDRQLLIDLSVITERDAGTGIQRVVRNLYHELLLAPPAGYRVCPVAATRKQGYSYLSVHCLQPPVKQATTVVSVPVEVHAGDLFLGLDSAAWIIPSRLGELMRWKRRGVRMHFLVDDLLPFVSPAGSTLERRETSSAGYVRSPCSGMGRSPYPEVVEADLSSWMKKLYGLNGRNLPCTTIQPGAELSAEDGLLPPCSRFDRTGLRTALF